MKTTPVVPMGKGAPLPFPASETRGVACWRKPCAPGETPPSCAAPTLRGGDPVWEDSCALWSPVHIHGRRGICFGNQFNLGGRRKARRPCLSVRSGQAPSDGNGTRLPLEASRSSWRWGNLTPLAQEQSQRQMLRPLGTVWGPHAAARYARPEWRGAPRLLNKPGAAARWGDGSAPALVSPPNCCPHPRALFVLSDGDSSLSLGTKHSHPTDPGAAEGAESMSPSGQSYCWVSSVTERWASGCPPAPPPPSGLPVCTRRFPVDCALIGVRRDTGQVHRILIVLPPAAAGWGRAERALGEHRTIKACLSGTLSFLFSKSKQSLGGSVFHTCLLINRMICQKPLKPPLG